MIETQTSFSSPKLCLNAARSDQIICIRTQTAGEPILGEWVLRHEDGIGIVGSGGRRSSPENESMSGIAGSLVGLVHVAGPPVLYGQREVRVQDVSTSFAVSVVV